MRGRCSRDAVEVFNTSPALPFATTLRFILDDLVRVDAAPRLMALDPGEVGRSAGAVGQGGSSAEVPETPSRAEKPKPVKQSGAKIKHVSRQGFSQPVKSAQDDTFRGLPPSVRASHRTRDRVDSSG